MYPTQPALVIGVSRDLDQHIIWSEMQVQVGVHPEWLAPWRLVLTPKDIFFIDTKADS